MIVIKFKLIFVAYKTKSIFASKLQKPSWLIDPLKGIILKQMAGHNFMGHTYLLVIPIMNHYCGSWFYYCYFYSWGSYESLEYSTGMECWNEMV